METAITIVVFSIVLIFSLAMAALPIVLTVLS